MHARNQNESPKVGPEMIFRCPRCISYLRSLRIVAPFDGFSDWTLAEIICDRWEDEDLAAEGTINFWTMDGAALILETEKLLIKGVATAAARAKKDPALAAIKKAVSPDQIDAARSPKGGWTRETLKKFGVPWPPPKGWRQRLIENYHLRSGR